MRRSDRLSPQVLGVGIDREAAIIGGFALAIDPSAGRRRLVISIALRGGRSAIRPERGGADALERREDRHQSSAVAA
jgi:hypothetical protein